MESPQIYLEEQYFKVISVDKQGKFFEKVSRIDAIGEGMYKLYLQLDINDDIYPMVEKKNYRIKFASSLKQEYGGITHEKTIYDVDDLDESKGLMDDFEYIMFGTIYKITETDKDEMNEQEGEEQKQKFLNSFSCVYFFLREILASFGGLLMKLTGGSTALQHFDYKNKNIYILIRKA